MAGEVVNSSLVLLSKFGASQQENVSKSATSHIRKTLWVIPHIVQPLIPCANGWLGYLRIYEKLGS